MRATYEAALETLRGLGADEVREVDLEFALTPHALAAYYLIAPAEASANLARYDGVRYGLREDAPDVFSMYEATRDRGFGREVKRRCLIGAYALSAGYYDALYGQAQRVRTLISRDFARVFESCDVLVCPTSPTVAFEIGALVDDPLAMYACDLFTLPVNLAGLPGLSIPCGLSEGLPGRLPARRAGLLREHAARSGPRARARLRVRPGASEARRSGLVSSVPDGWEAVIGLEIHVQLNTRSKMFCRCPNESGGEPNTRICPVCTAHPGVLPVPNRAAVEKSIMVGLALGSRIAERSLFYRKNYFYPDSPKAYQISQYDEPLCLGGSLAVEGPDGTEVVRFVRAHLEEDAAKTIHAGGGSGRIAGSTGSVVDFNRCGTPLLEIVTEPDLSTPEAARRFLTLLKATIQAIGVSDCDMEKGSLRCDANVSLRRPGESELRPKAELKNMNSFRFLERGIEAELRRQAAIYESGGSISLQTLHYDPQHDELTVLRSKEEADDYRYFPEPDLVPMEPTAELIERLRSELPELPAARAARFVSEFGLSQYDAEVLNQTPATAAYFEEVAGHAGDAKAAANWVMGELSAYLNEHDLEIEDSPVRPPALAQLIALVGAGTLGSAGAKQVFAALAAGEGGGDPARIVQERGLEQIADQSALRTVVDEVVAAHPAQAEEFRAGKQALLGFFVGQVMRSTGGRAEPRAVQELLREVLGA